MLAAFVVAGTLVAIWFATRHLGRGKPCPTMLAGFFDNRVAERFSGVDTIIRRARVSAGMKILDAGCGPGRLTIPLARHVGPKGSVVALDVQQGMLDRVRKRTRIEGLANVRTVPGALGSDVSPLDGEAGTFDRAFLVTVLGEVREPVAALSSIRTLLKPDGVLSITEMIIDPDYLTRDRVRDLAERAGFVVDRVVGSPILATSNCRIARS